jgi:phthalate 4,5-cis-dihydrodiol dehydrogenase
VGRLLGPVTPSPATFMNAAKTGPTRALKMGVAGLGVGAAQVIPTMADLPEIELVAGADVDPAMCAGFAARYPGTRTYDDVAKLFADPNVEAVWISTPNRFHAPNAIAAMRAGKHVAIEKPMAVTLAEADEMIAVAEETGCKLLAAHTSSYQLPVRAMRKVALSGEIGRPAAILIASYTDWMLRPRSADELSPESGEGMVHRQGPHQIDTLRLLGGGLLRSVRGTTGRWFKERKIPGFYTAYLEFENGMPATILHNGYGYFMTLEYYPAAAPFHLFNDADRIEMRRALRAGNRDEDREKAEFRTGGRREQSVNAPKGVKPWSPIDLGMVVLSCERGDVRHSDTGITVYADDGRHEIDLRPLLRSEVDLESGATIPALTELHAAVVHGAPLYHSGAWGRATLEATIAMVTSARERREIMLERQVAMPLEYDDIVVPSLAATAPV